MNSLRNQLTGLTFYLDNRPLRQRAMTLGIAILLLILLADRLLLRPLEVERARLLAQLQEVTVALKGVSGPLEGNVDLRTTLVQVKDAKADISTHLEKLIEIREQLVPPSQAGELLRDLVSQDSRLHLDQIETQPPVVLGAAATEASGPSLWRHRQVLEISGDYFALRDYLQKLESSNWKIYWESMDFSSQSGVPKLKLTFSTLSEEGSWLAL
ncbi:hypothetical protein [Chitinimonas naiadis]